MSNATQFDINVSTNECVDLQEQAKQFLVEYNNTVVLYNQKIKNLMDNLKQKNDLESMTYTSQVLVNHLNPIDIEKATGPLPEDMELITYKVLDNDMIEVSNDDVDEVKQEENIKETDDNEINEDNEYDDFVISGSKNRSNKGTGKGNYKAVYNSKHIRTVTNRKN